MLRDTSNSRAASDRSFFSFGLSTWEAERELKRERMIWDGVGWMGYVRDGGVVDWATELAPNASLPLLTRLIEGELIVQNMMIRCLMGEGGWIYHNRGTQRAEEGRAGLIVEAGID